MERKTKGGTTAEPGHTLRSREGRAGNRLVLVSNRGPVQHRTTSEGAVERVCSGGGVATALAALAPGRPITWIAGAAAQVERDLALSGTPIALEDGKRVRFVAHDPEAHKLFYGTFCNPLLWFIHHSMQARLQRKDIEAEALAAWQDGYLPVNQAYAEAVIDELDGDDGHPAVMLNDYHLYAAPLFIRGRRPDVTLQHFVHIPWPAPEAWRTLRQPIVQSICEGLLANDSVVFQTDGFARNFIDTCSAFLDGVAVDSSGGQITRAGRTTRVWANPVSVDIWDLRRELSLPEADDYRKKLAAPDGMRTIVRVDRLDPSKNAAKGFHAFGRLLERHPEWIGKVRFLAFLVPSRGGIDEYRTYMKEVFAASEQVNARYGTKNWTPITVYHEHNRLQALVAMSMYDVLLVNPVADGMNLVSKEGPAVNGRNGVLVLSEAAGSAAELRDGALMVRPDDIEGTAAALDRALRMEAPERRERIQSLREAIIRHDLRRWFRMLLEDIEPARPLLAPLARIAR
jgi:trehalose 6-phosphate synthase